MRTKEKLLVLLEAGKGTYLSGEEIADALAVSRTAVWKAVRALQADGYEIDAVQNRGYCLAESTDILSAQGMGKYLKAVCSDLRLEVLPVTESTNALLRERANAGEAEGYLIAANAQTKGRGRLGRSFYSPPDTGIYMSLLLRPRGFSPQQAVKLTTMAAVAACEAVEAISGKSAAIKWVNDVFLNGKKVCGILTEAAFHLESGSLDYIILGIGFNVYEPKDGFPPEIADIAGVILNEQNSDGKNRLAAEFLNRFMEIYHGDDSYSEKYREKSMVIGKIIQVITPRETREAVALDVDGDCRLIVRYGDGKIEQLSSGEVSIRPI